MQKTALTILCSFYLLLAHSQNTDLPGPSSNLETLPAGSYVIAMDNSLQLNSSGDFNLKAYGLVVHLLNNSVRIKWAIKAGKIKDAADFVAIAEQIKPTFLIGAISRNFKAGPFVIPAADTTGVAALIDGFYAANSLTGNNRPRVYRTTISIPNVDIRYNLTGFQPKAAILTDGGNQNIHLAYMSAGAIPSSNYTASAGTDLLSNCFTFASEPHNDKSGTAVNNAISAIKVFVNRGGNFLAQCAAIDNYENNSLGRFQTTGGINVTNNGIGTSVNFLNPDLSYSQFEGSFNASYGGSIKNWQIIGSPANNEHDHATGTGANANIIGASVSKHYYDKGGLVFYLGSHSFTTSSLEGINGIRMYLNAFLTPTNTNCPTFLFNPLALKLLQFSGSVINNKTKLQWTISNNEMAKIFVIEKSKDGINFVTVKAVNPSNKQGREEYSYLEMQGEEERFYRIKIFGHQGEIQNSNVITALPLPGAPSLKVLSKENGSGLLLSYHAVKNENLSLQVYDVMGTMVFSQFVPVTEGTNILSVPGIVTKNDGLYVVVAFNTDNKLFKIKVVK